MSADERHRLNISANGKVIAAVTRELAVRWEETKAHWQDAKAHEFEQKYMDELTIIVERAGPIFDDLERLIGKVRSDCE